MGVPVCYVSVLLFSALSLRPFDRRVLFRRGITHHLLCFVLFVSHQDKDFELEMTWVCDESNKRNVLVPADLLEEAITLAKEAKLKAEMDSDSDSESDDE